IFDVRDAYLSGDPRTPEQLRALLRSPVYVPETMPAEKLLLHLRQEREELAIVVDEYGGTAGLVTLGDMRAALLGEVAPGGDAQLEGGALDVDPRMPVVELAARFGGELPETRASTAAGLVLLPL